MKKFVEKINSILFAAKMALAAIDVTYSDAYSIQRDGNVSIFAVSITDEKCGVSIWLKRKLPVGCFTVLK